MGRLIPFVLVILIILGIVIGLPILLQPDSHREQLSHYLSQKLRHPVVIGKLDASFFPPVLHLHDVTVMRNDEATPLFRAERVDVTPDWGSLWSLKFVPSGVSFNRWLLDVRRRADGSWDWDEWAHLSDVTGGLAWPITELAWHQGECHWTDTFSASPQEVSVQSVEGKWERGKQQLKLTGTLMGLSSPLTLDFNSQSFAAFSSWSGDMTLTDASKLWTVHLQDQNQTLTANGQSSEWRTAPLWALLSFYGRWNAAAATSAQTVLHDWKSEFVWAGSTLTFNEAGSIDGGTIQVKGGESSSGASQLSLDVSIQNLPADTLAEITSETLPVNGKVSITSHFEVPVVLNAMSGLKGDGTFQVDGGQFHFPPTAYHTLAKAHTMTYFRSKYPNFMTDGLPVKKLSVHFQGTNGLFTIDKARLDAGDIQMALAAQVDAVRRGIDGYARLQIKEPNAALRQQIPAHYLSGAHPPQVSPIYGHIQGNWGEWSARAVSASHIPAAIQNRLHRSLSQPS